MAEILARVSLKINRLWLDKGFASIPVYRLLAARHFNAVIACPIRGKPTSKGTRASCKGKRSYHTFRSSTVMAQAASRHLTGEVTALPELLRVRPQRSRS